MVLTRDELETHCADMNYAWPTAEIAVMDRASNYLRNEINKAEDDAAKL
jgi:acetyl-CoA carboxylase carboxyltransferase component